MDQPKRARYETNRPACLAARHIVCAPRALFCLGSQYSSLGMLHYCVPQTDRAYRRETGGAPVAAHDSHGPDLRRPVRRPASTVHRHSRR